MEKVGHVGCGIEPKVVNMSVYLCVCTANLSLQSVTTATAKPLCPLQLSGTK